MPNEVDEPKSKNLRRPSVAGGGEWLAELEAATGKRIDARARAASHRMPVAVSVLRFCCAKTGLPYSFALKEDPTDGQYIVHETRTAHECAEQNVRAGASASGAVIEISDVKDPAIFTCPHCGGGHGIVLCNACGKLSCQGAVRREQGGVFHECPWCGNEGKLSGLIATVSVEKGSAPRADVTPLLGGPQARDALRPPRKQVP